MYRLLMSLIASGSGQLMTEIKLNITKTKEIVSRRPRIRGFLMPQPLEEVQQVSEPTRM